MLALPGIAAAADGQSVLGSGHWFAFLAVILGLALVLAVIGLMHQRRANLALAARCRELAAHNADLAATQEILPLGHLAWRPGETPSVNARLHRHLGEGQPLIHAADLSSLLRAEDRPAFLTALDALEGLGRRFRMRATLARGGPILLRGERTGIRCHLWIEDVAELLAPAERAVALAADMGRVLDALPYPVWRRGTDLGITWCNLAFARMLETDVERIIAEKREINAAAQALAKRAQRMGLAQSESQQFVIAGQRRLYDLTEQPLPDGSVIGFALDQTQLEESHGTLTRHVAAHDDVLQALGPGIVIFGPDRRVKFFNASYRNMFDLDASFLRSEPRIDEVLDMLRERRQIPEQADFRSFKQAWMKHIMSVIDPIEDLVHMPSGATYRMTATPHPLGGVIVTYEDVTDKLTLERNYNTLIAVQRETIDHLYEGIAVYGGDARLKLFNPAFVRMWGLDPDLLAGEPHVSRIIEAIRPFFDARTDWADLRRRIIAGVALREFRNQRLERKDGKIIDIAGIPLPDGGRLFKYSDVTDTINMERALRERNEALMAADRLKSEFIANVSYEFRTPLNAIVGYAELLARQYFGPLNERQMEYAGAVLDAAQSLILMIGDVIDVAAMEAGYLLLEPGEFDIRGLIDSTIRLFQERARAREVELKLDLDPDLGVIRADQKRMKQALGNILSAAINAAPAGRKVEISVGRSAVSFDVTVILHGFDDKISMTEAQDEAVGYAGVTQARRATHGLGIALARTIIELHGGQLSTKSGSDRRIISCWIPVETAAEAA